MEAKAPKLAEACALFETAARPGEVHVDGGVSSETAAVVGSLGADVLVVGSALFQRGRDAQREVDHVRERAQRS